MVLNLQGWKKDKVEERDLLLSAGFAPQELIDAASKIPTDNPTLIQLQTILNNPELHPREKAEIQEFVVDRIFQAVFQLRGEAGLRDLSKKWFEITGEHYIEHFGITINPA